MFLKTHQSRARGGRGAGDNTRQLVQHARHVGDNYHRGGEQEDGPEPLCLVHDLAGAEVLYRVEGWKGGQGERSQ